MPRKVRPDRNVQSLSNALIDEVDRLFAELDPPREDNGRKRADSLKLPEPESLNVPAEPLPCEYCGTRVLHRYSTDGEIVMLTPCEIGSYRIDDGTWATRAPRSPVEGSRLVMYSEHRHVEERGAEMSEGKVVLMRRLYASGWTRAALSKRFGVSVPTIRDVVTWRTWRHLPRESAQ